MDFSRLTLQQALDLAVLLEEEARDRYEELAEQLDLQHEDAASGFFRKLVRVEELHRSVLHRRRVQLFGEQRAGALAPSPLEGETPHREGSVLGVTPVDALALALRQAVKAHDFLAGVVGQVSDPEARKLLEWLKREEAEHQRWIRAELERYARGRPLG